MAVDAEANPRGKTFWLWRWLQHRLSKRQSPSTTTVLFRTTFTRTIKINPLLKWLLGSNLSQNIGCCWQKWQSAEWILIIAATVERNNKRKQSNQGLGLDKILSVIVLLNCRLEMNMPTFCRQIFDSKICGRVAFDACICCLAFWLFPA